MCLNLLKRINKKLLEYFLLILFIGYIGSITLFTHTHIVDGITVVHSHPYKSHSGNIPINHNHSKNGFILIQFISNFIAITPLLYLVIAVIRKTLNNQLPIQDVNLNLGLFHNCSNFPRAPTL
jgi:hypothetical protein